MTGVALPVVAAGGVAVYVLASQAPPTMLPPGGTLSNWDPMNLAAQAPAGQGQKVDALLAAAYAKFQGMADDEKTTIAAQINQQYNPQPPLTGRETWQQTASVIGGAIGGAYGGPLGAIAGSYLGVTLESWLATSIDDIKSWINQNVPGVVDGVVDDIKNWLGSIF